MVQGAQYLLVKEKVIKQIRSFFDERKFHEIVTPVFHDALPLEPTIYSFSTQWSTSERKEQFYLATSPESTLKKALASGIGNCYSIAHAFRNLESAGPLHKPEFLMLEWYREDATHEDIMTDVRDLFSALEIHDSFQTLSLEKLFTDHLLISIQDLTDENHMRSLAKSKGYSIEEASWEQLFNQLFFNEIEPYLPFGLLFLTDFPAKISPLAKPQKIKTFLAERFEVFFNRIELGNGNTEHLDIQTIRKHFDAEKQYRIKRGLPSHPIDEEFLLCIQKLQQTEKPYAGIGMGIDRLVMIVGKQSSI